MDCINLKERFGRRYRVQYEESFYAERGERARADDPWLQIIPCQRGHLYPWGPSTMAAATSTRGPTAHRLAAMPYTTIHQDGSDGITVLFPVAKLPEVAGIMGARRRRQPRPLTDAQRAALAAHAFRPRHATKCDSEAQKAVAGA
jgi:hypothetical protein